MYFIVCDSSKEIFRSDFPTVAIDHMVDYIVKHNIRDVSRMQVFDSGDWSYATVTAIAPTFDERGVYTVDVESNGHRFRYWPSHYRSISKLSL